MHMLVVVVALLLPIIAVAQETDSTGLGERSSVGAITWKAPLNSLAPHDVRTEGALVEAVNATDTNAGSVTVNGVVFSNSADLLSSSTGEAFLNRATTGDLGYDRLLGTLDFGSGPNKVALRVGGGLLTPGHNYLIQVWWTDARSCCTNPRQMAIGDGLDNSVILDSYGLNKLGQYAVGHFTAGDQTQLLTLDTAGGSAFAKSGNAHITAYQIRNVPPQNMQLISNPSMEINNGDGTTPDGWAIITNSYGAWNGIEPAQDGTWVLHPGADFRAGGRFQDFRTVVNTQYDVRFWATGFISGLPEQRGLVQIGTPGSNDNDLKLNNNAEHLNDEFKVPRFSGTEDWVEFTHSFTATSKVTRLSFQNIYLGPDSGAINIDQVSVIGALVARPTSAPGDNAVMLQSINFPDFYISHRDKLGEITSRQSQLDRGFASFRLVPGLADGNKVSFESVNRPGNYLRHQDWRVKLHRNDGSRLFREDATFARVPGLADESWISFESHNYPGKFLRHRNLHLWVESGNTPLFRNDATFTPLLVSNSDRPTASVDSGGSCYWMTRVGSGWGWVSAERGLMYKGEGKHQCYLLDSCDGGMSRSGGGCYKWAFSAEDERIPWGE